MMKFWKICCSLGLALAFVAVAPAAEVEGILMDKMCSNKALGEGQKAVAMHTRDCALMDGCIASGFGVVTADNKFLALDEAGNKQAEKALRASKQKDNLRVRVTGDISGDTIKVSSLKIL